MRIILFILTFLLTFLRAQAQTGEQQEVSGTKETTSTPFQNEIGKKIYYGNASYYAEKFNGRKTANGEIYHSNKMTAACNVLPLGTWIRVTNLRNNRSVIVRTNDRLHPKMKRVVDLSRVAAEKLGYIKRGLTQVRVEVIGRRLPAADVLAQD